MMILKPKEPIRVEIEKGIKKQKKLVTKCQKSVSKAETEKKKLLSAKQKKLRAIGIKAYREFSNGNDVSAVPNEVIQTIHDMSRKETEILGEVKLKKEKLAVQKERLSQLNRMKKNPKNFDVSLLE